MQVAYLYVDHEVTVETAAYFTDILRDELIDGVLFRAWSDPEEWFLPYGMESIPKLVLEDLKSNAIPLSNSAIANSMSPELSTLYRTTSFETLKFMVHLSIAHGDLPLTILPSGAARTSNSLMTALHIVDSCHHSEYSRSNVGIEWFATVHSEIPDDCIICLAAENSSPLWQKVDVTYRGPIGWRDHCPY